MSWKNAAAAIRWNIQPFIGGCYRPSVSQEIVPSISPATGSVLCQMPVGDPQDIDVAVRMVRARRPTPH